MRRYGGGQNIGGKGQKITEIGQKRRVGINMQDIRQKKGRNGTETDQSRWSKNRKETRGEGQGRRKQEEGTWGKGGEKGKEGGK